MHDKLKKKLEEKVSFMLKDEKSFSLVKTWNQHVQ